MSRARLCAAESTALRQDLPSSPRRDGSDGIASTRAVATVPPSRRLRSRTARGSETRTSTMSGRSLAASTTAACREGASTTHGSVGASRATLAHPAAAAESTRFPRGARTWGEISRNPHFLAKVRARLNSRDDRRDRSATNPLTRPLRRRTAVHGPSIRTESRPISTPHISGGKRVDAGPSDLADAVEAAANPAATTPSANRTRTAAVGAAHTSTEVGEPLEAPHPLWSERSTPHG